MIRFCLFIDSKTNDPVFINPDTVSFARPFMKDTTHVSFTNGESVEVRGEASEVVKALKHADRN